MGLFGITWRDLGSAAAGVVMFVFIMYLARGASTGNWKFSWFSPFSPFSMFAHFGLPVISEPVSDKTNLKPRYGSNTNVAKMQSIIGAKGQALNNPTIGRPMGM